jgi:hypothetical protein
LEAQVSAFFRAALCACVLATGRDGGNILAAAENLVQLKAWDCGQDPTTKEAGEAFAIVHRRLAIGAMSSKIANRK